MLTLHASHGLTNFNRNSFDDDDFVLLDEDEVARHLLHSSPLASGNGDTFIPDSDDEHAEYHSDSVEGEAGRNPDM